MSSKINICLSSHVSLTAFLISGSYETNSEVEYYGAIVNRELYVK